MYKYAPHSTLVKVIAIAALGSFAFGAISYSFANAQNVTPGPTGNATTLDKVTGPDVAGASQSGVTTTANASEVDTFFASGQIASVVADALSKGTGATTTNASTLEILGGRWEVGVINSQVMEVQLNMSMAKPDGSNFHIHMLDNFTAVEEVSEIITSNATGAAVANMTGGNQAGNVTTNTTGNETTIAQTTLSQDGTFEISGTVNIYTGNRLHWQNVPVTIESAGRVLIINVDHEITENHFKGQPIYGFVTALIGEQADGSRKSLLPPTMSEARTAPTGPALAGNGTGSDQTASETTASQTGGASGGGGTTGVSITPSSSSKTTDAFDPNLVEVGVGDTVTWTNDDFQPHTVTSGSNGKPDGKFDSSPNLNPLMTSGQTFSHTFEEAGEFPYFCAIHPNMVGTVSVT